MRHRGRQADGRRYRTVPYFAEELSLRHVAVQAGDLCCTSTLSCQHVLEGEL